MKTLERASRRPQRPITRKQWGRLLELHKQVKTWTKRPDTAPKPDASLMLGTEHGPIKSITVENIEGEPWVYIAVQNAKFEPFPLRPEIGLAVSLLLAFGGSLFANQNRKHGRAYLSLFANDDTVSLARIVSNAKAKEVIKQRFPDRPGYDPESLIAVPVDYVRHDEKLPMRTPGKGRSHAIAVASANYHRRRDTGIDVSARHYLTLLREACALIDTQARYRHIARQDAWFDQYEREFARAMNTHRTPEDEAAFNEFNAMITGKPYPPIKQDDAQ